MCKAQMLGLQSGYHKHFSKKMFGGKLMALCYLPAEHIIYIYVR